VHTESVVRKALVKRRAKALTTAVAADAAKPAAPVAVVTVVTMAAMVSVAVSVAVAAAAAAAAAAADCTILVAAAVWFRQRPCRSGEKNKGVGFAVCSAAVAMATTASVVEAQPFPTSHETFERGVLFLFPLLLLLDAVVVVCFHEVRHVRGAQVSLKQKHFQR